MREIAISKYIYVGTALRYLQDTHERMDVKNEGGVIDNIERLVNRLEEYSMPVSHRAAWKLERLCDELRKLDDNARLTKEQADEIKELADSLRNTIFAEASGIFSFVTSEKRYSTQRLLSDMPKLMAKKTFIALPEIAQIDLNESGKCIAFERSTAGAFHVLRAAEAVLRHLYCSIVKRGRVSPLMWAPMVTHLRKRNPTDSDFLDQLDIIRKNFRNPTQHPDKTYNTDEVQNLLGLCIHAIDMMVAHPEYKPPAPAA